MSIIFYVNELVLWYLFLFKKNLTLLFLMYKCKMAFSAIVVLYTANYPLWLWMGGRKYESSYSRENIIFM